MLALNTQDFKNQLAVFAKSYFSTAINYRYKYNYKKNNEFHILKDILIFLEVTSFKLFL
jgi:hypothetical protein